jgi:hypothetical protein
MKTNITSALLLVTLAAKNVVQCGTDLKSATIAAVKAIRADGEKDNKTIREMVITAALDCFPEAKRGADNLEAKNMRQNVSIYLSQSCGVNVRAERSDKKGKGSKGAAAAVEAKTPLSLKAILGMLKSLAKQEKTPASDLYAQLGDMGGF